MKASLLLSICVIFASMLKSILSESIPQKEVLNTSARSRHYKPDWKDLDSRPLPKWYDAAKIGVFMHWGVYSVPSLNGEWFWKFWLNGNKEIVEFMSKNYPPNFTYQDFGREFTAEFFDPDGWAHCFSTAGFKYVVLTTKHHDGYTLFPSRRSFGWNSVDVGPKRDLVGDLAKALSKKNLRFGAYHSLFEWFNPIFLDDWNKNTDYYPGLKTWPDMKQLVNDYKPSLIWADGVHFKNYTYWNSTHFLAWLYNDSPVKDEVVVNDRWGYQTDGKHGDFYNNGDENFQKTLQPHKWENVFKLYTRSWSYVRNMKAEHVLSMEEILNRVVITVSCGGNALMDFGPTKEGTIPAIIQDRLMSLGKWLKVNGKAIYGTSPWFYQRDETNGHAWYTCKKSPYNATNPTSIPTFNDTIHAVYVTFLKWPDKHTLRLKSVVPYMKEWKIVHLLGYKSILKYQFIKNEVKIYLPERYKVKSDYAWSLKFT